MPKKKDKVALVCPNCHQTFYVIPFLANPDYPKRRKFCSQSCSSSFIQKDGSWNKGIPHTDEEKLKISVGGKRARQGTDYVNPATRPEVRAKISATITKLYQDPRNNSRYIDGRSGIIYPFEFDWHFKEKIRARDNFTCQICGITQDEDMSRTRQQGKQPSRLIVHHKDENRHNLADDNVLSVCRSCHAKHHGVIVRLNEKRRQERLKSVQYVGSAQN